MEKTKLSEKKTRSASALILAVVLTALLALIGTVFLMVARVDKIATSAVTENKELQFALESVVAEISQQLALDVPGNDPNQEYYDYPDPCNAFLASLEPNESGFWRQISDVTGYIISPNDVPARIVGEHDRIDLSSPLADADGDGVADSIWIKLNDNTSRGKPVFAAIRLIDNGGMLNVNTAYKFDPNEPIGRIDGSSQMQVNLMALSWRPGYCSYDFADETDLRNARCNNGIGVDPLNLALYEQNVIWRYGQLLMPYTPFGIDDELEMRNRFLLNHEGIDTRLEGWGGEFRKAILSTPVTSGGQELDKWFKRACFVPSILDPNLDPSDPNYYAFRHISTTYNMDRIITPDSKNPSIPNSGRMLNVNGTVPNDPNVITDLYNHIRMGFADAGFVDDSVAAQLAVNIKDFRDSDPCVSVYNGHYGFEQPCVYISELAHRFLKLTGFPTAPISFTIRKSYAIELHKPYESDVYPDPTQWRLAIESYAGSPVPIDWSGNKRFHVILFEDPCAPIKGYVDWQIVDYDPNLPRLCQYEPNLPPSTVVFDPLTKIELQRLAGSDWITVDSVNVHEPNDTRWWVMDANVHSFQRDITRHKCIRRLWDEDFIENNETLGSFNNFVDGSTYKIQAHPENQPFTGIGDIGKVFRKAVYSSSLGVYPPDIIGYNNEFEADVRLNLAVPAYQHIFNYLTVMDPAGHISDPTETRIKGRININTAPWFVIAQLPWVRPQLAQKIVDYRDTNAAFESIGELNNVIDDADPCLVNYINYYSRDFVDQFGFPDLTANDGAPDDFEERDLIFSRISNLVTVRSDVFTAYILVRVGVDGPQKRVIAIFDRSQAGGPAGKVKIVALHPVPDPR